MSEDNEVAGVVAGTLRGGKHMCMRVCVPVCVCGWAPTPLCSSPHTASSVALVHPAREEPFCGQSDRLPKRILKV